MWAGEWLFTGMNSNMINQLIFGLEGAAIARTTNPVANMGGTLGSSHMLHRQMGDDLVHRMEYFVAGFAIIGITRLIRIYP